MYTSDKTLKKHLLFNVIGTAFLALFAGIYEAFSHGVYSYFMLFAFAVPLMMGVLPYTILLLIEKYPNRMFLNLWKMIKKWFKLHFSKLRDIRTHKYFSCPKCKNNLRVPKGKGEIVITCPVCKTRFDAKT